MRLDISIGTKCKHCKRTVEHFDAHITHNLTGMADEAGIYGILWEPKENGIETAKQLIKPLEKAIGEMEGDPERFKRHDSPNGWGLYIHFLPCLKRLLDACVKYPDSEVEAYR